MGSCSSKKILPADDGSADSIVATIAMKDAEIVALKTRLTRLKARRNSPDDAMYDAMYDGTGGSGSGSGSGSSSGGDGNHANSNHGFVADASGGAARPGGLDGHGLGPWRFDGPAKKKSSSVSISSTGVQAGHRSSPRLLLPAQEIPPELTITYIRAKQFIVGALPQPHGFSSFKADFTAKGTARWSQLLDAEDVLVQQMLFRFSELESLELARTNPLPTTDFLHHLAKKATRLLKRKGSQAVFGKSTEFLTAKKHVAVAVDTKFSGTQLVVKKQGKNGMVVEAIEPVDAAVHVVIHRVGDAANRYPVKKSYLEKNYVRTSLGTYSPSAPATVFWQVQQNDLIVLGTASMIPSFACEGSTGERVDVGDFIRIHKNEDDSFEFYCIGKSEWKDTYAPLVDMPLQKEALTWFGDLAKS